MMSIATGSQRLIGMEGVITFEERDEFVSVLRRLTADQAYAEWRFARSRLPSLVWGRLDGKSGQRMVGARPPLAAQRGNP